MLGCSVCYLLIGLHYMMHNGVTMPSHAKYLVDLAAAEHAAAGMHGLQSQPVIC
jgi:hypothetical protein